MFSLVFFLPEGLFFIMSKDPAFLFYSQDFYTGTIFMTDEQVGKYIRLLCLQHQTGHLEEKHMINICKTYDVDIFSKFTRDSEGKYYNERLENEVLRRTSYSENRRQNRMSRKTYVKHMETETEAETIIIDNNINYIGIIENFHTLCPKLPHVEKLSDQRKKHIHARFSEFGEQKITEVFRLAGISEFLNGKNDRTWRADFDWLINPNNFIKVIEGKYNKTEIKEIPQAKNTHSGWDEPNPDWVEPTRYPRSDARFH